MVVLEEGTKGLVFNEFGSEVMSIEYLSLWPENRWVKEDTIRMWYADAVANGEIGEGFAKMVDIMEELQSAGFVTFTTQTRMI